MTRTHYLAHPISGSFGVETLAWRVLPRGESVWLQLEPEIAESAVIGNRDLIKTAVRHPMLGGQSYAA
jgi:hypothetical protein